MALRGADPARVRAAVEDGDPLVGSAGFAGRLDGALVRDVLGRELVYYDGADWAFDPDALDAPTLLPAGTRRRDGAVEDVWSLPTSDPAPADAALRGLTDALDRALDGSTLPDAVAFSGGLDSALLAHAAPSATLYAVGFPGSPDLAAARESAAALDRSAALRVIEVDHEDLRAAVPDVVEATGRRNAMDVGIALPLLVAARRASADGHDCLAVGQGADELFGGYAKVADAPDDDRVAAATVRGARDELLGTLPAQAERDLRALRAGGVEPVTPYLHDRVVRAALSLPADLLADGDRRKVGLRRIAGRRMPEAVAERPKRAMQYGSRVARELDRLARRDGYKRRQDDHVEEWIASLT